MMMTKLLAMGLCTAYLFSVCTAQGELCTCVEIGCFAPVTTACAVDDAVYTELCLACDEDKGGVPTSAECVTEVVAIQNSCTCGVGDNCEPTPATTPQPAAPTPTEDPEIEDMDAKSAVLNDYVPPPYVASTDCENMHGVPRLIGDSKFDYENQDYLKGVIATGVPQIVIGILLLLCMPCCVCAIGKKQSGSEPSKLLLLITLGCLGMAFIGVIIGASGNTAANSAGDSIVESVFGVETLLANAGVVFDGLADTATKLSVDVEGIDSVNKCPSSLRLEDGGAKGEALLATEENLIETIQTQMANIVTFRDEFQEENSDMIKTLRDTQVLIDDYNGQRSGVAVTALMFCFMLLSGYAFTLLVMFFCQANEGLSRAAMCIGKIITPFSIFVIGFVWIFAGFVMILAVFSADFCLDIDTTVNDLMSEAGDSQALDIIKYYQTCAGENPFADTLDSSQSALDEASLELQDDALNDFGSLCGMQPELDAMGEAIGSMIEVRASAELLISCGNISKLYQKLLHTALCDELVSSLALQWGGAFTMGFFFFFGTLTYRSYATAQAKYISERHSNLEMKGRASV